MLPAFAIDGGAVLVAARAVTVAALLSAFGSLAFRHAVALRMAGLVTPEVDARTRHICLRLSRGGLVAASAGLLAWLLAQSADLAGARTVSQLAAAVPVVLWSTVFGHLVAAQGVAVVAAAVVIGRRDAPVRQATALMLAAAALGLQAGHGHAAAMEPGLSLLLAASVVHLVGAAAWLGGLLPLLLVVRGAPAKAGALAARWFTPLGKLCLVALTASSLVQGWVMVGSIPGLVGTAYGWMVLVKLGLFGVLFGFALANRYRFAPALLRDGPAAKRVLVRSIAVQTGFGLAIVAAAAVLSSLPPAMHEQPLWPFPDLFTLDTMREDPDVHREVLGAGFALAGAAALLAAAACVRRLRAPGLAAAATIAWFSAPHLSPLFVPANPTSFYRSPTGFTASSIVAGAALYPVHCASCHGATGHGDGPAAAGLAEPPADLTAAHLWMHSDGELFWWLAHGIEAPDGQLAMPAFGAILSDDERWDLIDAIRARNAGAAAQGTGTWSPPLQAPGLQATCADGRTVQLADLRGGFVSVVIGPSAGVALPGVTTILATADPATRPTPGQCVTHDAAVPRAYATVAGLDLATLPGTAFLIDPAGWLRAAQPPAGLGWNDPATLAARLRDLAAHPIAAPDRGAGMPM